MPRLARATRHAVLESAVLLTMSNFVQRQALRVVADGASQHVVRGSRRLSRLGRTMARADNPSIAPFPRLRQAPSEARADRPTTRQVFGARLASSAAQEFLERKFFDRVALPNGTFKTTNAHRLDDLNQAVLPHLPQLPGRALKIMDVSISSGVSTLEWHDFLNENGIRFEMVGTDLTVYTSLVSLGPQLEVLIDRGRNILHLDAFGRGLHPRGDGLAGLAAGMIRMLFEAAMTIDRKLPPLQGRVQEAAEGRVLKCQPVTLLTRGFSQRESLQVFEDDLLGTERPEFNNAFHVVRAANILNRAYFSDQALTRIATKLKMRLKANGLLVVCRTADKDKNNATIFEARSGEGLRAVSRLGAGSEIEDLLVGL
jgi:hypothetical protein